MPNEESPLRVRSTPPLDAGKILATSKDKSNTIQADYRARQGIKLRGFAKPCFQLARHEWTKINTPLLSSSW